MTTNNFPRPRGAINFPCYIEHSIHSHWDNNNTQKPAAVFCLFVNELPLSTCFQCLILQVYNTCSTTWSKIVQSVMLHLLNITDLTCDYSQQSTWLKEDTILPLAHGLACSPTHKQYVTCLCWCSTITLTYSIKSILPGYYEVRLTA